MLCCEFIKNFIIGFISALKNAKSAKYHFKEMQSHPLLILWNGTRKSIDGNEDCELIRQYKFPYDQKCLKKPFKIG